MVSRAPLYPLPGAVSISRSPIRAISSTTDGRSSMLTLLSGALNIAALVVCFTLVSQIRMQLFSGFLIRPDIELDRFMADGVTVTAC